MKAFRSFITNRFSGRGARVVPSKEQICIVNFIRPQQPCTRPDGYSTNESIPLTTGFCPGMVSSKWTSNDYRCRRGSGCVT